MRSQDEAVEDAKYYATQLVDALQDADATEELALAESLYTKVSNLER